MKITIKYYFDVDGIVTKYRASCLIKYFPPEELFGYSKNSFKEAKEDLIRKVKLWRSKPNIPRPEKVIVLL